MKVTQDMFDFLEELKKYMIIVEGKKDSKILKDLGCKKILPINSRPLEEMIKFLKNNRKVVILTDFDRSGRKKFKKLARLLESYRIKPNNLIRRKFKKIFRVSKVEEIAFMKKSKEFTFM